MKDWRSAPDGDIVCYCKGVSKASIVTAIESGNNSLDMIRKSTDACTGGNCKELNPSGKCCSPDIIELINIYSGNGGSDKSCCSCCS